jgi:hypothetical protein
MEPFPNFRDLERIHGIRWHDLVALESKLAKLLWEAHRAGASCRCSSHVDRAFAPIRQSLTELVGFAGRHRGHPILGSSGAYDVTYWKLYDAVAALVPATGAEEAGEEQRAEPSLRSPRKAPFPVLVG